MRVLGLDIGGANLKAADGDGRAVSEPFALWRTPERLSRRLGELARSFDPPDAFAVTMTGELADCFTTKAEGVDRILAAVEQFAGDVPVFVWQTGAEFVAPSVAREIPRLVAAANWHALATWAGRSCPQGLALLIDVGSTTTDFVPLQDGVPIPDGLTDLERLLSGELVYSGVRRTPLCALAQKVPFREGECPLAAELFATTLDVHLVQGDLPENPDDCATADGRPATIAAARNRLARMLCCDHTECTAEQLAEMARFLADVQLRRLSGALERVRSRLPGECGTVLLSGSGAFLAERLVRGHPRLARTEIISLAESFTGSVSECACAFAVARLGVERLPACL